MTWVLAADHRVILLALLSSVERLPPTTSTAPFPRSAPPGHETHAAAIIRHEVVREDRAGPTQVDRPVTDKVEKTVEAAIEVVDKVAAETFQCNEMIKEAVAEEMEEDANELIEKLRASLTYYSSLSNTKN